MGDRLGRPWGAVSFSFSGRKDVCLLWHIYIYLSPLPFWLKVQVGLLRQRKPFCSVFCSRLHLSSKLHMCFFHSNGFQCKFRQARKTTPVGFEPTRGDPIGLAGRRLNRSAKVSLMLKVRKRNHSKSIFSSSHISPLKSASVPESLTSKESESLTFLALSI